MNAKYEKCYMNRIYSCKWIVYFVQCVHYVWSADIFFKDDTSLKLIFTEYNYISVYLLCSCLIWYTGTPPIYWLHWFQTLAWLPTFQDHFNTHLTPHYVFFLSNISTFLGSISIGVYIWHHSLTLSYFLEAITLVKCEKWAKNFRKFRNHHKVVLCKQSKWVHATHNVMFGHPVDYTQSLTIGLCSNKSILKWKSVSKLHS